MNPDLMQPSPAPQPPKNRKRFWIIIAAAAGAFCLFTIICIVSIAVILRQMNVQKEPVAAVLDAYMKAMEAKDVESAYALFSPRAQLQVPITQLQEGIKGNNFVIYEGYQSLFIDNLNLKIGTNTNPTAPQGLIVTVTGVIRYNGGIQGTYNGTLEKVKGKWMIYNLYITVPPNKLNP